MKGKLEQYIMNLINNDVRETLADYNQRIDSNQNPGTIINDLNRETETYNYVKEQSIDMIHRLPDGALYQLYETQLDEINKIHKIIELLKKKATRKGKSSSQTVEKRTNRKDRNSGSDSGSISKSKMEHGGMRMRKKQTVRKQLKHRKTRKHRS